MKAIRFLVAVLVLSGCAAPHGVTRDLVSGEVVMDLSVMTDEDLREASRFVDGERSRVDWRLVAALLGVGGLGVGVVWHEIH